MIKAHGTECQKYFMVIVITFASLAVEGVHKRLYRPVEVLTRTEVALKSPHCINQSL